MNVDRAVAEEGANAALGRCVEIKVTNGQIVSR